MAQVRPVAQGRLSDRSFFAWNAAVSIVALLFIAWILVVRRGGAGPGAVDLRFLPAVNASLNALAALLLGAGWVAIRRGAVRAHQRLMVTAFAVSVVFLVSYLVYHYVHGDTRYAGTGALRAVYLSVLATHVVLSIAVPPLALTALWLATRRRFHRHARVARVLVPIWLYVSLTGVAVFLMLRAAAPASPEIP